MLYEEIVGLICFVSLVNPSRGKKAAKAMATKIVQHSINPAV
jgi:hypothetical protein